MQYNPVLETIYANTDLTQADSHAIFSALMQGKLDQITTTALLVALKMKGESTEEIAGAASAMVENARPFPTPDYAFSDIVGTGGDGHNTINISSSAALVAAACGVKVAKHGNKSVSSKSGSSDLYAGFGLNLMMSPEVALKCLNETNFCFLAAPNYHAGVAHVMPVRGTLATRTIFNILGPLANPAQPTHGVYGVYCESLLDVYAQVLSSLGHKHALVVHGSGLDEVAMHDKTEARRVSSKGIESLTLTPADFGAATFGIEELKGGEPEQNKAYTEAALSGKGAHAHMQAIAVNAATLMWVNGVEDTQRQCFDRAMQSMQEAAPLEVIHKAAAISNEGNV